MSIVRNQADAGGGAPAHFMLRPRNARGWTAGLRPLAFTHESQRYPAGPKGCSGTAADGPELS
jgi:hypothetical protein